MRFQSFAHIGKKLSNIFKRFYTIFERFYIVFKYFQTFSNVFERFLHELARLMRKSALLIEILTLLRINSCPAEALAKADARLIDFFSRQDGLRHSQNCLSCPFLALPQVTIWATCIT
jgi:hypothetical protein